MNAYQITVRLEAESQEAAETIAAERLTNDEVHEGVGEYIINGWDVEPDGPQDPIYVEQQARALCSIAVRDGVAAEMLNCLSYGGAVTFDPIAGRLVFATAAMLRSLGGR